MISYFNKTTNPKVADLGGKGYSLAVLTIAKFNVPKGFVVVAEAFSEYLRANALKPEIDKVLSEINENNFREKSREARNIIHKGYPSEGLIEEVKKGLINIGSPHLSIRSSAVSEDNATFSLAGAFDTYLNVSPELDIVMTNIQNCWASLLNERAVLYKLKTRIPLLEGMAVVIQRMISAITSGVTFTSYPLPENKIVIEAAYGIGDMIVSGRVDPESYQVNRTTLEIEERTIPKKMIKSTTDLGDKKDVVVVNSLEGEQVLSDNEIKRVARECMDIEKMFNAPQDIEWCIDRHKLWILQSRPITGVLNV